MRWETVIDLDDRSLKTSGQEGESDNFLVKLFIYNNLDLRAIFRERWNADAK